MKVHPPLLEPDKRISRHPALEVRVETGPLRWPAGTLAAPSQVLHKTAKDVEVDLAKSLRRIPVTEVVSPALQMPVDLLQQER